MATPANRNTWATVIRIGATAGGILVLLGCAGLVSYWIKQSEPTAEREAATRRSAAIVETIEVESGTHRPTINALGAVVAARDIVLSPQVGGQIVSVEPGFTLGGVVEAGQLLLSIDPADYQQALVTRESEMYQVQAELAIEQGQQRVAQREFELLGADIEEANRSLVLREPQIESLRAKLKSAEAAVEQAKLDLARTEVRAPFDGQILARSVELGSQVTSSEELARIVGTDAYWVIATVPLSTLRWIEFPNEGQDVSGATITHRTAWPDGQTRQGRVARLIGEVDQSTRMARVIVEVPDPLGAADEPALILGSIVQAEIEARSIHDVVRLDRAYLRQGDTVWVMQGNALRIQPVDVVFADEQHAYISDGLSTGDRVVTTSLATVVDGLEIRESDETAQVPTPAPDPAPDQAADGAISEGATR